MGRLTKSGFVLVATSVGLLALVGVYARYERCYEVDVTSGRIRYQRTLFGHVIKSRVEETGLSKLFRQSVKTLGKTEWRKVSSFRLGSSRSPHYAHHGAIQDMRYIEEAFATAPFSKEATAKVSQTFFELMQGDDRDSRSGVYAGSILELAHNLHDSCDVGCDVEKHPEKLVSLKDLPPPPAN